MAEPTSKTLPDCEEEEVLISLLSRFEPAPLPPRLLLGKTASQAHVNNAPRDDMCPVAAVAATKTAGILQFNFKF